MLLDAAVRVLYEYRHISQNVSVRDLQLFLDLGAHLKTRITWCQRSSTLSPPDTLPVSVFRFLCSAIGVSSDTVKLLWHAFKDEIWSQPEKEAGPAHYPLFLQHGLEFRIGFRDLYPPTRTCLSCTQLDTSTGLHTHAELGDERDFEAVLFTHDLGAIPVFSISLYCHKCHTRYHPSYYLHDGAAVRTYYPGLPRIVPVSLKFYATSELCERFANEMVCAWVSGLNNARIYNMTWRCPPLPPSCSWPLSFELQCSQVWDAFFAHSLLIQAADDNRLLELAHQASSHAERLRPALEARTQSLVGPGRELWNHACENCCKEVPRGDGTTGVLRSVVTDGITLGHPCCAVHDCENDLPNGRAIYCREHSEMQLRCVAIVAGGQCPNHRQSSSRVCNLPEHRALEVCYKDQGRAMFQLKKRLEGVKVSQTTDSVTMPLSTPNNPAPSESSADGIDGVELEGVGDDGEVEVADSDVSRLLGLPSAAGATVCPDKPPEGNRKLRARFGQRRTHNEELVVASCGIITARKTFFGSEAVSKVIKFWKETYPTPASLPGVLWMDNNCSILKSLEAQGDTTFESCANPVDVFHFKVKHKDSDTFCAIKCNPAQWPELMNGDKWVFNSSAAEQANVWMGGYRAIVRQMRKDRYNFFLDEMIKRRNRYVVNEQVRKGLKVATLPMNVLLAHP